MVKAVIFSGPPGVGKSTLSYKLAQKTGWALISKDCIDCSLKKEGLINGRAGYEILLELGKLNLQNNVSIILDAVFTTASLRERLWTIGRETNATLFFVVCTCSDEKTWKKRVRERPEMVESWTPADWQEAQEVQAKYVNWTTPHLLLDSMNTLEQNFQKIIAYVKLTNPKP